MGITLNLGLFPR